MDKLISIDGLEAIEMIKELELVVVILDIIMPNLDGIGVLETISEMRLKHRPIFIVITAMGKDIIVQKAIEFGAEYYIVKPFDVDMLVSRIRQLHSERVAAQVQSRSMHRNGSTVTPDTERNRLEQIVASLIKRMWITPNIAGYRYLNWF